MKMKLIKCKVCEKEPEFEENEWVEASPDKDVVTCHKCGIMAFGNHGTVESWWNCVMAETR